MSALSINNQNTFVSLAAITFSAQYNDNANIGGFVVDESSMSFIQASTYSTWDFTWTNWPPATSGRWYYYDPDSTYASVAGAWTTFSPTSIPHSWIIMKAVKFAPTSANPLNIGTAGPYIVNAVYGNYSGFMNITLDIQQTFTQPSKIAPYSEGGIGYCDKALLNLTSSGGKAITYPWGSYATISPVRPLCQEKTISDTLSYTSIGDLKVKASVAHQNVSASAWFDVGDVSFPKGFTAVKFTGYSSMSGDVVNPVSFVSTAPFTLKTPQVSLDYAFKITERAQAGALVYNRTTGSTFYIPADKWNDDAASPLRMQITVPKTALLIFGHLDYATNSVLPAYLSQNMQYLTKWGAKTFTFFSKDLSANDNLEITIAGTEDLYFAVSTAWQYVLVDSQTKILGVYSIGYTKSPSITLTYPNNTDTNNYVWGVYQSGQSTATGSGWVLLNTTTTNTTISTTVTSPGFYGIIHSSQVNGAAGTRFAWSNWMMAVISLYFLI